MYGRLKGTKIKRRATLLQNAILVGIAVFTFLLAGGLHDRGIAERWATAILGTAITFGFVAFAFRSRFRRWTFWVSFLICFGVHLAAVWLIFHFVLAQVQRFSIWFGFPAMLFEAFILLIAVKRIEESLMGERYTMRLSF